MERCLRTAGPPFCVCAVSRAAERRTRCGSTLAQPETRRPSSRSGGVREAPNSTEEHKNAMNGQRAVQIAHLQLTEIHRHFDFEFGHGLLLEFVQLLVRVRCGSSRDGNRSRW
jgi:hypothetical protein